MQKNSLINQCNFKKKAGLILLGLLLGILVKAQPSGGPYGPVQQSYELPKTSGTIYYVAPDGNSTSKGDKLTSPTTIEEAIKNAKTGDAIILRGGTYRTGDLVYNQGITIQPYANEEPVLKGTYIAKDWENLDNGLWKTKWEKLFPMEPADWWRKERAGRVTPIHLFNNDMVFADGKFLNAVGWLGDVDKDSYYIDYKTGNVYIGVNPDEHLLEITAFNVCLHRVIEKINGKEPDKKGSIIRGITFTQYAYRAIEIDGKEPEGPAKEEEMGKEVVGSVFENCTISFCSRVAAYLRGDNLVVRNCKVHDTSTEGLFIFSASDVLLERNIFSRNNIEQIEGYYPAAVKIFNQTHRAICRDNLIIDIPYSHGIWYDVGNIDGQFINNWVENVGNNTGLGSGKNLWPSYNGFFFEISKGAICAGNVFVNCDRAITVLNSSNVEMYQNTFVNSSVCLARDTRSAQGDHFGWHPATGPDVDERHGHVFINNLLVGDENYTRPLLFVWQKPELCDKLSNSPLKQFDNNVFVQNAQNSFKTIAYWSPYKNEECQKQVNSFEELKKVSGASANSQFLKGINLPVFKSPLTGNFQLQTTFPGTKAATELPAKVKELLKLSKKTSKYIGAYPVN